MKLLSWNIQWGRGMDGRVDLARILQTIRQLGDFDVICLQEVAANFPGLPCGRGEDQVAELSAGLPGYTAIYGAATDVPDGRGGRSRFGNVIFSHLPVGQVWRHLLPWPAEPATPSMHRRLVEAVVENAGRPAAGDDHPPRVLLATPAPSPDRRHPPPACRGVRHVGAPTLDRRTRRALRISPRPTQALLCGDMNFSAGRWGNRASSPRSAMACQTF